MLCYLVNHITSSDAQFVSNFSSVQSFSHVQLFATPWIAARQASLSITNPRSSLKLTSIESVMPSSHLILCRPLLLLPPIPPSIRVFSNESALHIRWPKYQSFSFSISLSKEHPGLISFRMDWLDLLAVKGTLKRRYIILFCIPFEEELGPCFMAVILFLFCFCIPSTPQLVTLNLPFGTQGGSRRRKPFSYN